MPGLSQHIENYLRTLGSDDFAVTFLDFIETLDVDQIMVFSIEADLARCFMSRHFAVPHPQVTWPVPILMDGSGRTLFCLNTAKSRPVRSA